MTHDEPALFFDRPEAVATGDDPARPKRQKGGRPRATDLRRPRAVRLSDAEWAAVCDRAARLGTKPHALMRDAALGRRLPVTVPTVNREAWAELAATTANLNQLAARLNRGGEARGDEVMATLRAVAEQVRRLRLDLVGVRVDAEDSEEDEG